ncbi:MAG: UDP-N-acetylglucosamine transferase subunit ALG14 [Clostridium sp.]|nr:UDP-N-acetylglucosamine transferase subunit ALG14 [Clostridium sp.]
MKKSKKRKNCKICFAASSGGHFEQLMMLKPLMEKYDSFIVTEKTNYNSSETKKTYYMKQVNRREISFISKMIFNLIKSFGIFLKEKPDVIICTGVLAVIPICIISKIFGRKLIYIESFAKVTSPTETGKLMYKYADKFYVQWSSMLKIYPNAIYLGGIY